MSIKQARLMREVKQKEMAEFLGIHVQTYRKIELHPGSATVDQAKLISEKLNIPLDEIFFAQ